MKYSLIVLIGFVIACTGCISSRKLSKTYNGDEEKIPYSTGLYENCPQEGCKKIQRSLFDILNFKFIRKDSIENWQNVNLQLSDHRKYLLVEVYQNDSLVESKKIKGKWKNNSFHSRRMIRPIGIPLIYYVYYEKKVILNWTNDHLIVSLGESKLGMILIMSAGVNDYTWARYKRINTADKH